MAAQRKLFEEVSGPRAAPPATPGLIDRPGGARGAVRAWLLVLFALVALMIAVGGMTRLTDSGLSITEWRPVTGAIPPLSEADWAVEFEKYKGTPQHTLLNPDMTLQEFKAIYWWEWGHRQLGRVVGLVWALGFAALALTRRLPPGWSGRLWLLGALGGAQGAIGWWMVSSGLEGRMVSVASYRLAIHLGLAFVILGLIAWYALALSRPAAALLQARRAGEPRLARLASALMLVAFVQIVLGALVAGIDAGRAFPTWPLMNGSFFPANAFYTAGAPGWTAWFENPGLVQFVHRTWGYALLALAGVAWWRARQSPHPATSGAFAAVAAALAVQVGIGIGTVLYAAPWQWGIVHQIVAVAVWVLIVRARHRARWPVTTTIRGQG
ncbi:MAG: COX15/CtaA family protein [Rhodobacteraceae bacterium]|nr:COX15/CtaA family protein [Paracoccaceae bacterium]